MSVFRDKKGWLRIAEAFIAIILIVSALLIVYARVIDAPRASQQMYNLEKTILNEIASDNDLRERIVSSNTEAEIQDSELYIKEYFVAERVQSGFNFDIKICEIEDICNLDSYYEEVYVSEKIVSSTLQDYNPRKIKIFMWEK